jgi:hypothetical protein
MFRSGMRWWFSASMTGLVIGATTWFLIKKWQAENPVPPEPTEQIAAANNDQLSDAVPTESKETDDSATPEAKSKSSDDSVTSLPLQTDEQSVSSEASEPAASSNTDAAESEALNPEPDSASDDSVEADSLEEKGSDADQEANEPSSPNEEAIRAAVQAWAKAWSDQDVERYISSYSEEYKADQKSHAAWIKNRSTRLKRPKWIRVDVGPLSLEPSADNEVIVTFWQIYRASNYQDETQKRLMLREESGQWKIVQEQSNP